MGQVILSVLLGLILFLFGCFKLSEVVSRAFNLHLRSYVSKINQSPFWGLLIGFILTLAFQSSSASVILAISLVSAGLLTFRGSLPFILSAGLASFVTPFLVAFKITDLAPFFIVAGGLVWLLSSLKIKKIGETLFYFGLLFFGLGIIAGAAVLGEKNFLREIFLSSGPLLGFLAGLFSTVIFQASAIPLSILVILKGKGAIEISQALPIILGVNLAAVFTEVFSSLGTNKEGRRTALSLLFFRLFGVIVFSLFLNQFASFLSQTFRGEWQILAAHFLFNLFITIVFLVFLSPFTKIMTKIIPKEEAGAYLWPFYLNKNLLKDPVSVFKATRKEFFGMAGLLKKMFEESIENIFQFDKKKFSKVDYKEMAIDNIQAEILKFLDKIPKEKIRKEEAKKIINYAEMTDELERIADRIGNINKLSFHKNINRVEFSEAANLEIKEISLLVKNKLLLLEKATSLNKIVEEQKDLIEEKIKQSKDGHLERFYKRTCATADGSIFNNILINLGEISDHCQKVIYLLREP